MSRRGRLVLFGLGAALLAATLVWGLVGLPDFGHFAGRYGRELAHDTVAQRKATNSVMVTTFDYRALDTLGEELILFVAAVAVALILRGSQGERATEIEEQAGAREEPRTSESLRWLGSSLVGPIALLATYVVVHGHLTPGGGFQGGVILAAAIALPILAGRFVLVSHLRGEALLEAAEALGAAGFALIGLGGLIAAGQYLHNFVALGSSGLHTGGTVPLSNLSVGLEVGGALLVIVVEMVDLRFLLREDA